MIYSKENQMLMERYLPKAATAGARTLEQPRTWLLPGYLPSTGKGQESFKRAR